MLGFNVLCMKEGYLKSTTEASSADEQQAPKVECPVCDRLRSEVAARLVDGLDDVSSEWTDRAISESTFRKKQKYATRSPCAKGDLDDGGGGIEEPFV